MLYCYVVSKLNAECFLVPVRIGHKTQKTNMKRWLNMQTNTQSDKQYFKHKKSLLPEK